MDLFSQFQIQQTGNQIQSYRESDIIEHRSIPYHLIKQLQCISFKSISREPINDCIPTSNIFKLKTSKHFKGPFNISTL
uniref:Uncharacterized protein n=1 Tax=Rhizophora mucronata TaxID=61149 RepID=A0A2P2QLH0_RHIMU